MSKEISPNKYTTLIKRLADIIQSARATAVRQINKTQVLAYHEIGREIVEFEQKGKARAGYGEELIKRLSKDMTAKFGRGFSERNLRNIRAFYISFPIWQTVSAKSLKSDMVSHKAGIRQAPSAKFDPMLYWSHYCELLSVENPLARAFYEQEAVNNNWSFRELKRQINSQLFERLSLSKDTQAVMRLAKRGHIIETPEDAIKDPYVLEFLNLKEETIYTESHLEQAIMDNLQKFLLEMGRKDEIFAKYVLGNLNNKIFASKYKLALPSEKELVRKIKSLHLLEGQWAK